MAAEGTSRPPPRVQKRIQPSLGSLASSSLCRNTFVPPRGAGVACTFPLSVPSGPLSFGPQGFLVSYPNRTEKSATFFVEQQGRDKIFSRIGTPLLFLWPDPSSLLSVWVLFPLLFLQDEYGAVGPPRRTLLLVDGVGMRPRACL